jgi:hypothetical protein
MFGTDTPCVGKYPLTTSCYDFVPTVIFFAYPSHSMRIPDVTCTMTTLERAASVHGGCDRHWSYGSDDGRITANTVPPKIQDIVLHTEAAIETTELESEGSEFSLATRPDTSQRKLNRWQAALIYITNQVGVGILGLPSVMQTLGLIPGIICIIGLGMYGLN